jgi:hypothetical protein
VQVLALLQLELQAALLLSLLRALLALLALQANPQHLQLLLQHQHAALVWLLEVAPDCLQHPLKSELLVLLLLLLLLCQQLLHRQCLIPQHWCCLGLQPSLQCCCCLAQSEVPLLRWLPP